MIYFISGFICGIIFLFATLIALSGKVKNIKTPPRIVEMDDKIKISFAYDVGDEVDVANLLMSPSSAMDLGMNLYQAGEKLEQEKYPIEIKNWLNQTKPSFLKNRT